MNTLENSPTPFQLIAHQIREFAAGQDVDVHLCSGHSLRGRVGRQSFQNVLTLEVDRSSHTLHTLIHAHSIVAITAIHPVADDAELLSADLEDVKAARDAGYTVVPFGDVWAWWQKKPGWTDARASAGYFETPAEAWTGAVKDNKENP
jgi:hypothetical protein